jgi:hypothetical protein
MKKTINQTFYGCLFFIAILTLNSCSKSNNSQNINIPESKGHFLFKTSKRLFVSSNSDSFKIKIGLTSPSSVASTITLATSSATATEGVDYKLSRKTIVIPAGKVLDSFYIMPATAAAYTNYIGGRRDSVTITITTPGVGGLDFNKTYTVQLREACDPTLFVAGDFDFLLGEYDDTRDDGGSGSSYKTVLTNYELLSSTQAIITVGNLWDAFAKDLKFSVDFSNTSDIQITPFTDFDPDVDVRSFGFNVAAGRYFLAIRPNSAKGTLDACAQTITLNYDIIFWDALNQNYVVLYAPWLNQSTVMAIRPE